MKTLLICLLIVPNLGWARTILEPSLSVNSGIFNGTIDSVSTNNIEANYTTFSGGLRYGITRDYIHLTAVADAYYVSLDSSDITAESKFQANFGVGFGYEWNIPLRTYVIIGVPTSSVEMSYYYSESFIIGLKYNKMSVEIAGSNQNVSAFGLTVSFPIEFDYPSDWWRKKEWL